MTKVHWAPWLWAATGGVLMLLSHLIVGLSAAGWIAGFGYLLASTTLLTVGLARRGARELGAANAVTATRSMLVGVVTALVATSVTAVVPPALVVGLVVPALLLDAADGWLARRTRGESELGARFDMEVDAFLLLVLGVFDAASLGWWVLAIGLMRYVYVAAGRVLPWLRAPVPFRYWRKVVAATCGITLALGGSGLVPVPVSVGLVAVALGLLCESFGRDVIWLYRRRRSMPTRRGRVPDRPERVDKAEAV